MMQKVDMITDLEALKDSNDSMILNLTYESRIKIDSDSGLVYEWDLGKWNSIIAFDTIDTSSEDHITLIRYVSWGHASLTIYYNQILSYEYE